MRRIARRTLPQRPQTFLNARQVAADRQHQQGTLDVEREWRNARRRKAMEGVGSSLKAMLGSRERCMYCEDSKATDIEHFRPKARYVKHMFDWFNLLLCCTECGRFKGSQFPVNGTRPLLIDPTKTDPWKYLDFDPDTGALCARFDVPQNNWSPRGAATVAVLQLDKREALSAGYRQTWLRLSKIVNRAVANQPPDAAQFVTDLIAADDHGLLPWCFGDRGRTVQPFSDLRAQHPKVWRHCRATVLAQ
jgi:uncharacterized protein (TIGR02646 family)